MKRIIQIALLLFSWLVMLHSTALAATCTPTQVIEIDASMNAAGASTRLAFADLPASASDARPNYARYFGAYDPARADTVKTTLNQVLATMTVAQRVYDCLPNSGANCDDGHTMAWVKNDEPYKIYICERFYGSASSQREAVLVHELSHFLINGGTDSTVSGHHCGPDEASCLTLAQSNPGDAVRAAYAMQLYVAKY